MDLGQGHRAANSPAAGIYGTKGIATPGNLPGTREFASIWSDTAGNLWLFGGEGYDGAGSIGALNDLWEYSGGLWVWISGADTANDGGFYGTPDTADSANRPPARWQQSAGVDSAGHFWIFGGSNAASNLYSDLWEFDPTAKLWTWVSGRAGLNQNGIYGTLGVPDGVSMPGGRYGHNMEIDRSGNILIFGGNGKSTSGYTGPLNDLWSYNLQQQAWTWLNGSQTIQSQGQFGTKGLPAATNLPPSRYNASSWLDPSDNLWIFGGTTENPFTAGLDNVWEFAPFTSLPIESVSLQGLAEGNNNLLTWQTLDELNSSKFTVQRSMDGSSFSAIGTVESIGSGNNSYSFTDTHVIAGSTYYYRLEMKDKTGTITYSQTILLQNAALSGFTVYPNPATNFITIQFNDNSLLNTPIRLLTLDGRLIIKEVITGSQQMIDISQLALGIYLVQFANGPTIKISKE